MAVTSAKGKASIKAANDKYKAQSSAAKSSGGSKTTLNAAGTSSNQPISSSIAPTSAPVAPGGLDQNLQNLANTNPEAADAAMDSLGYTGSPNSPERQAVAGSPDLSKIVGAQYYDQKTGALNEAGNKYKNALSGLQASGPAPQDAGQGKMQAAGAITNTPTPPSPLGGIMETDKNFDNIFLDLDKYMEPLQQKKSLLQEYKSMSKQLGIEDINEELIDARQIIEGSEDDIRAEVTAAGGFATDSQVLSMANARNKSLIKNYNVLLESRDNAMQQLDTMMDLTVEDRRAAEAEFDRKMNFTFKIAEFQERAKANSASQLNKLVENVGYAGLLQATNGNAYEQSIIEKTLGLGVGGLQRLASYTPPQTEEEQLDNDLKRSSLETDKLQRKGIESSLLTDKAQRANIQSQIDERNNPQVNGGVVTLTGKPQTAAQSSANGYADRVAEATKTIDLIGEKFATPGAFGGIFPNILQSGDRQAYEQSKRNFVNAVLRRESGAAISPTEFSSAEKQYFPQAGDQQSVLEQKTQSRNTAINNLYREANVASPINTPMTTSDIDALKSAGLID